MHAGRSAHRWLYALAAAAIVVTAACSDSADSASDGPDSSTTTTTTDGPSVAGLDFVAGSETDLGHGWAVSPCESGPPLFCARRRGEHGTQSVIELLGVPTSSYPAVKRALDAGASPTEALRAHAAEYQATFQQDRPSGCGAGYRVEPFGPDDATVAGGPGVMYGFDGHQDGRHVERSIQFATIRGDILHVIFTNAVDDGTCMDDGSLAEFSVAELAELQPKIVEVIAASTLP